LSAFKDNGTIILLDVIVWVDEHGFEHYNESSTITDIKLPILPKTFYVNVKKEDHGFVIQDMNVYNNAMCYYDKLKDITTLH